MEEKEKVTVEDTEEKTKKQKKNKKDEEIEILKQKLEAEHDLLLRTAAEFDNFKKRTERERLTVAEFAKANVIKELLPILDKIDRNICIKQLEYKCEHLSIFLCRNITQSIAENCTETS